MNKKLRIIAILLIFIMAAQAVAFAAGSPPLPEDIYYSYLDGSLSSANKTAIINKGKELESKYDCRLIIVAGTTDELRDYKRKYETNSSQVYYDWVGKDNERSFVSFVDLESGQYKGWIGDELNKSYSYNKARETIDYAYIAWNMHKGDYDDAVKDIYMLEAGFIEDYFKEKGSGSAGGQTDENKETAEDKEPSAVQEGEGDDSLLETVLAIALGGAIIYGVAVFAKEKLPAFIRTIKSRPKKKKPVKEKPIPPPPPKYTDESAVKLEKCSKAVSAKITEISDSGTKEQVGLIAKYLDMIAEEVQADPRDRGKVRKLANHIAPMIQETVEKYAELEKKMDRGNKVTHTLSDLKKSIGLINDFLHDLLDDLFTNDSMEATINLEVLESLVGSNNSNKFPFDKVDE